MRMSVSPYRWTQKSTQSSPTATPIRFGNNNNKLSDISPFASLIVLFGGLLIGGTGAVAYNKAKAMLAQRRERNENRTAQIDTYTLSSLNNREGTANTSTQWNESNESQETLVTEERPRDWFSHMGIRRPEPALTRPERAV